MTNIIHSYTIPEAARQIYDERLAATAALREVKKSGGDITAAQARLDAARALKAPRCMHVRPPRAPRRKGYTRNNARDPRSPAERSYGMKEGDHALLVAGQNGVCAVCGRAKKRALGVDHCHTTKLVRGLLCFSCNVGIGHFNDDPALLAKAIAYLADPPAPRILH